MHAPALIQTFAQNHRGRDYAVGDLHGCFSALETALVALGFDPRVDRLFSVGDLVDRGPESERLGEFLDQPWFHAVRGNHDQMMIDAAHHTAWHESWQENGGGWSLDQAPPDLRRWRDHLDTLPLALEIATADGPIGLVHANLLSATWAELKERLTQFVPEQRPLHHWDDEPLLAGLLWSRTLANRMAKAREQGVAMAPIPDLRALVIGHTVMRQPLNVANLWAIDTGACYGFPSSALTLLDLTDLQLMQLPLPGSRPFE